MTVCTNMSQSHSPLFNQTQLNHPNDNHAIHVIPAFTSTLEVSQNSKRQLFLSLLLQGKYWIPRLR